jgi:hypothetical protein
MTHMLAVLAFVAFAGCAGEFVQPVQVTHAGDGTKAGTFMRGITQAGTS